MSIRSPSDKTLQQATKLAIAEFRPIMMDYWELSLTNKVFIAVNDQNDKILMRSKDEYTTPIAGIFKVDDDFIVKTENSLYLVSASIKLKRVSST